MPPDIRRRTILAGSFGLAGCLGLATARPALAAPRPQPPSPPSLPRSNLLFQVSRNATGIGTHRVDFTTDGAGLTAHIEASFKVGFGFIVLYRYHHQAHEHWQDGSFQSLHATTNDNGAQFAVHATRTAGGILIRATGLPDQLVASNALPLTHWAIATMDAPLFNPETGKMLREAATPRGAGTVALANGTPIAATRYALGGETPIDDWYDKSQTWAALDGRGKDGSAIAYRRA